MGLVTSILLSLLGIKLFGVILPLGITRRTELADGTNIPNILAVPHVAPHGWAK